jgi:hypothetical protein
VICSAAIIFAVIALAACGPGSDATPTPEPTPTLEGKSIIPDVSVLGTSLHESD